MMDLSSQACRTTQDYASFRTQDITGFSRLSCEPVADDRYQSLSGASRTKAVAQGQRELMEMVKNMPESCHELSLQDLVEKPTKSPDDCTFSKGEKALSSSKMGNKRQNSQKGHLDSKAQMMRSGSLENGGFLLKMVFPASSLGSRSVKGSIRSSNGSNNDSNRREEARVGCWPFSRKKGSLPPIG
ncbi:hypothetical protein SAY86_021122 [Trapa natans]|uniref:Uncharacterized protein n=1 Tax=Trapa natans TaxID=22666 RepID=A0AAN7MRW2_TRANT|nr:hypothetical protein SAY86_021122 [Trapa natans]